MRRRSGTSRGFTLLEILVVSLILGILAAVAIFNYLIGIQRGRQKRTMADMRAIAVAWESRAADTHLFNGAAQVFVFPTEDVAIADLTTALTPTYIRSLPRADGWEHPYDFGANAAFNSGQRANIYAIRSGGRDGLIEASYISTETTNFDCDIVYTNGGFAVAPQTR